MRIVFENVGRNRESWEADYPHEVSLEAAAENEGWWLRQLRGVILSSPDWAYNAKDNCVYIFAGWCCVGTARIAKHENREATND